MLDIKSSSKSEFCAHNASFDTFTVKVEFAIFVNFEAEWPKELQKVQKTSSRVSKIVF